jgi:ferredoxin-NADP reductase
MFKHNKLCLKDIDFPFEGIRTITMIAVGAGLAPMLRIIRAVLDDESRSIRY